MALGLLRKLGHRLNLRTNTKKAPAGQRRGVGDGLISFFFFYVSRSKDPKSWD